MLHICEAKARALLSAGYGHALGDFQLLESYWEVMSPLLDNPPDRERWACTVPYCLWGDEGTINNSGSWMFGTMSLASIGLGNGPAS